MFRPHTRFDNKTKNALTKVVNLQPKMPVKSTKNSQTSSKLPNSAKATKAKTSAKPLPDLDPKLFWDVRYTKYSLKKYPGFVVERVIQRGSQKDLTKLIDYFGKTKIKELLLHNDRFSPINKAFLKTYFGLTEKDLCSLRPSFPKLWEY